MTLLIFSNICALESGQLVLRAKVTIAYGVGMRPGASSFMNLPVTHGLMMILGEFQANQTKTEDAAQGYRDNAADQLETTFYE